MSINKKAIVQLAVPLILGLALVGLVAYFLFIVPQAKGLSPEEVQALLDQQKSQAQQRGDIVQDKPTEARDNNPITAEPESTTTNTPPPTEQNQQVCTPSGKWEQLYVKRKMREDLKGTNSPMVKSVAVFRYTGNCVSDVYLEAGISPGTQHPLAAMPLIPGVASSSPSACDANRNYYGTLWKDVKPDSKLIVNLRPVTPSSGEGRYRITVGAYTGCLSTKTTDSPISSQGKVITDNSYEIAISNNLYSSGTIGETPEAFNSWERVK